MTNPRRFKAVVAAASAALMLLAAGCNSSGSKSSSDQGGGLCPDGSIHIGIAKAKTGGFAGFDTPGGNGSLVGIDQVNANGGVDGCKLKVEWKDTQSDPAVGQQVTTSLIGDGAQIIIAPSDFDIGVPSSLAAKAANVFTISPEASSTDWPKAAGPNMFVEAITENDLGAGQAAFANSKGWKTGYSVINDAFNFFKTTEAVFDKDYDGKIVSRVTVADDASDYSAVISRIRALNPQPDFIYLADYYPHVGTFIKQLRDAGLDLPVLGNPTYSSPELAKAVGTDRMTNVFYVGQSFYEGAGAAPEVTDFIKRYQDRFGEFPPNANAIAGYEGVLLLVKALEVAKSTKADDLSAAMSGLTNVKLPGAEVFKFVDGYTVRSSTVIGFNNSGQAIEVQKIGEQG